MHWGLLINVLEIKNSIIKMNTQQLVVITILVLLGRAVYFIIPHTTHLSIFIEPMRTKTADEYLSPSHA